MNGKFINKNIFYTSDFINLKLAKLFPIKLISINLSKLRFANLKPSLFILI